MEIQQLADIQKKQFDTLYQVSQLLNQATFRDSLISDALDLVINVLEAERGLCAQYIPDTNSFTILTARNVEQNDIDDLTEFSSGILEKVVNEKKPVLYHDVQSDPTVSQFKSIMIHEIKSIMGVPIFQNNEIWGVIVVDSLENRQAFSEENLEFMGFFSNMLSLALDRTSAIESLEDENAVLRNQVESQKQLPNMIGNSPEMHKVADLIHRVAKTDATVLLLGESGTGKDLAAQAIHQLSKRKEKNYIAQFCGSIPDTLLESELFGYKKGAFSGAACDKKGLFEVASNGTFFLDEIGDISTALQAKLLRVLQNQEIIRLGDTQIKKVDVRIITATNKNIKNLVKDGTFREDLYYRLNIFPITLPPLRARISDVVHLVDHFIKKYDERKITPSVAVIKKLEGYHWPGNIRQLENVIQRALILCDGDKLLPEHIILEESEKKVDFNGTLKEFEKDLLLTRLKKYDDNRTQTAKSLGVSVRWVQLKLKEMEEAE